MAVKDIVWEPTARQLEALKAVDKHVYTIYGGSRGGGKSHLGRFWVLLRALTYKNSNHLIVRSKLGDLRANHIDPIIDVVGVKYWFEKKKRFELPNGSVIQMYYLRDKASIESHQGQEYQSIFIDEATQIPESLLAKLYVTLRTTRRDIKPRCLLSCNPGGVSHGYIKRLINRQFINEKARQWAYVGAKVYDNPWLDREYVLKLEALPEPIRSAWLEGDWDSFEGSFFSIDPKSRLSALDLKDKRFTIYGGLDHGTAHATCFTLGILEDRGYEQKRSRFYLMETYLQSGRTARDHAMEIFNMIASHPTLMGVYPKKIFYDPAMMIKHKLSEGNQRTLIDEYQDIFSKVSVDFIPANNNRQQGAQIMRELFKVDETTEEPMFFVHEPRSRRAVEYLHTLQPDPQNPEKYAKSDTDADDFSDALRYMLAGMYSEMAIAREGQESEVFSYGIMNDDPRLAGGLDWYSI